MDYTAVPVRVRYADTDRMGIVYYGTYPQYFEIGRTELMRKKGLTYRALEEMGFHLVVTSLDIRYYNSATYDDELTVLVRVEEVQSRAITFHYRIEREGVRVVEGKTRHICVNSEKKTMRIPAVLSSLFSDVAPR